MGGGGGFSHIGLAVTNAEGELVGDAVEFVAIAVGKADGV